MVNDMVYNPILTNEQNLLCERLRQMKLSGMAEELEKQFATPNADLRSFDARLENIINYEWELRFNKKFTRFLKKQL